MTSSSSSSSSSKSKSETFDVFLSFRGVDTRITFVSHLEKDLKSKGIINTFKDDEKLEAGDRISDELIRAIENSKFAIVVMSKNYASSGCCLEELAKIMELEGKQKLRVIPIFYQVDPSEVRYQKGTFEDAFVKHNNRQSEETINKWREALNKVAGLDGLDSRNSSDDAALVTQIVTDISKRLLSMVPRDFGDIIGMDKHIKALDPLLNMESGDEVRMIGIWGMGGVGKTTIAECLYNMYKDRFQFHCFIRNVKKIHKDEGVENLQAQFLSKILRVRKLLEEGIEIDSYTIKLRLCHQKVLAVLDDIDRLDQLEALANDNSWFGPGSRIIITSRGSDLFRSHGVQLVYKAKCLEWETAHRLFQHFAFGGKQVPDDFIELSNRALELVKGHPLAIKVLGKDLHGKKIGDWEGVVCRLVGSLPKIVMECLKVSYEGLDDEDKSNILTIAWLLSINYKGRVKHLLDGEEWEVKSNSLNTLAEKALIDISNDEEVTVHDLVQEMTREIVRQESNKKPQRQRFLWDHEDICSILEDGPVIHETEGISLDMSKIEEFRMGGKSFGNMPNLKFLVIRNTSLYRGDLSQLRKAINHLPWKLKLLDWEHCPLITLPPTFKAKYLVDLQLPHSHLQTLSEKDLILENLRRLELSCCLHLKEIPNLPKNLVHLDLSMLNIRKLPEFPNLSTLQVLDLSSCKMLSKIPDTIENLSALQRLNLSKCKQLMSIPDTIGNLSALQRLNLSECKQLMSIPDTIGNLSALKLLKLSMCEQLMSIPDTIGNLSVLWRLDLSRCKQLRSIPDTIGNLSALDELGLLKCEQLMSIPDTIGNMAALSFIQFSECKQLRSIPNTIGNLSALISLDLSNCKQLMSIPDTIGNLYALRKFRVSECKQLRSIPDTIWNLPALQQLNL